MFMGPCSVKPRRKEALPTENKTPRKPCWCRGQNDGKDAVDMTQVAEPDERLARQVHLRCVRQRKKRYVVLRKALHYSSSSVENDALTTRPLL
jgi:hypothetical protein